MPFRKHFAALIGLLLLLATPAQAGPREDADRVRTLFERTFNAGDWDKLATLFTADAHYFGGVRDELVVGQNAVRAYLTSLPKGLKVTMREHAVVQLEPTVLLSSGYLVVTTPSGGQSGFKMTMVLHNVGGYWLIAQYHAAQMQKQ